MTVIAIQRTRNGVPASADTATLRVLDSIGGVAVNTTTIAPTGAGVYSYDAANLGAGRYQAIWTFHTAGYLDDVVTRVFQVDSPAAISEGVTLADIERLVARRVGPYMRIKAGMGSTQDQVYAVTLKSSLSLGSYEDQFLLRRGLGWSDELIANYTTDDRVRQIASYDSVNGLLIPDRSWSQAPSSSPAEALEIHYLDPENELRPCVLDGLKRCFFWDEIQVSGSFSGAMLTADLTAVAPWLDNASQVRTASYLPSSVPTIPRRLPWWETYRSGRSVLLRARGGGISTLVLKVLRPVSSLVNDTLSVTGPDDGLDTLQVKADYAAWAGVLEVWKNLPERIQPLTVGGLRPTLKEAAAEFSKQSLAVAQSGPSVPALSLDYGYPVSVIGNLAEPY